MYYTKNQTASVCYPPSFSNRCNEAKFKLNNNNNNKPKKLSKCEDSKTIRTILEDPVYESLNKKSLKSMIRRQKIKEIAKISLRR